MRPYTLEEVIQPYKKYPRTIQNAILLAHTHPAFLTLTKCTRKVLYALLTRACQHDGCRPIKARIDRLALEADVSDKTVQRAIAIFRKIGWVEQANRRSEFGLFCSRQYQFSPALCALVRLPVAQQVGEIGPQETEMSDGAIYIDLTFKEDQRQISIKELKGKPVDLPDALQQASDEFLIRPTGIAKLRGIARSAGHELEHIVTVARQYMHRVSASGNRAYRYLESMAVKPAQLVNYQARASQVERLTVLETQAAHAKTLEGRCQNKRFVGPAGLVVRVFETGAELVQDGIYRTVPYADLPRIYALVEEGTLREADPGMQPAANALFNANSKPQPLCVPRSLQPASNPNHGIASASCCGTKEKSPVELHLARLRALVGLTKKNIMGADFGYTTHLENVNVA
ncbi:MAG: hypothetical protein JWM42_3200 [Burkholderia sp.]|nr:hypothetical protein [Burkholderia sp.]